MTSIPGFDVVEKLKGPLSSFFSHITQTTGCQVLLRGRGSGFLEPSSGKEAFEAMYMFVSHNTPEELTAAVRLCQGLLDSVKQQYEEHKQSQKRPSSGARADAYGFTQQQNGYGNYYNDNNSGHNSNMGHHEVRPSQPPPPPHMQPSHYDNNNTRNPSSYHHPPQNSQRSYPAATYYHPPPPPPPPPVPASQPSSMGAYIHPPAAPSIHIPGGYGPSTQPPPGPPPPPPPGPPPSLSGAGLGAGAKSTQLNASTSSPALHASTSLAGPSSAPHLGPSRSSTSARVNLPPPSPDLSATGYSDISTNANTNSSRKRRFRESSPSDRSEETGKRRFQERVRPPTASLSPSAHRRSQSPTLQKIHSPDAHSERPENGSRDKVEKEDSEEQPETIKKSASELALVDYGDDSDSD